MIPFKSLQQRFSILVLIPVAILMIAMGFAGFSYARNQLLTQWGEATILKLQRAAHHVDMRLSQPKQVLKIFQGSAGIPGAAVVQNFIVNQLAQLEGVAQVDLRWADGQPEARMHQQMHHPAGPDDPSRNNPDRRPRQPAAGGPDGFTRMPPHMGGGIIVTSPHFDSAAGSATVSLISDLKNENGEAIGRVEVKIPFRALIETVEAAGWWQDHAAFLLDEGGHILASNLAEKRSRFGDTDNPIEEATLQAMQSLPFGTVFGKGYPPKDVGGFYKLQEAPWTLVLIAPGGRILSLLIRFRIYYFAVGCVFIVAVLFLIRFVTGRTAASIKDVSEAAHRIAAGNYEVSLSATTSDEVGELIHSFNTMIHQLEERTYLKYSLNLAMEVQRNLLPGNSLHLNALDIAGQSIYCDETGGDYYDFIRLSGPGTDRIGIAVGDVSGHGIASALFMTTARAMIRSRMMHAGTPAAIVTDVNRLLCLDTAQTGNFMTLFFLVFDIKKNAFQWVRAGHEPAIFYDAVKDEFAELKGKGIALGVDESWSYEDYACNDWHAGRMILIGTDGIWETENQQGERFGKKRLCDVLRRNHSLSAAGIVQAVIEALTDFRGKATREDDITLVVLKATSGEET